jgi:DNA-binding response OmpR family regulator
MATRGLRTPSILLVNDTFEEHKPYAHTLQATGYRVIIVRDSVAAYQIATARPPDIAVIDVRITGSISGLELTRRLRSHQRTSAVGIIVLTIPSRPHDADVALKAGADACLEKPVSGSLLKAAIARLLPESGRQMSQGLPRPTLTNPADVLDHREARSNRSAGIQSKCPRCGCTVIYRERWAILVLDVMRNAIGSERLRYVSGWFCMNPACDHYQLSREPR